MAKTPEELCEERRRRVLDTMTLKKPDRIPIYLPFGVFGAKYAGITVKQAYEDTARWKDINEKMFLEYQPDYYIWLYAFDMVANEMIDNKLYCWPGHGVPEHSNFQYVEHEYMPEEEYDIFIDNPGEYIFRYFLPRAYEGVSGLGKMPPFWSILSLAGPCGSFAMPEVVNSLETLIKAAKHNMDHMMTVFDFMPRMEAKGFPDLNIPIVDGLCPFDLISDHFRGLRSATLDMFRNPDKLLAAEAKMLPYILSSVKAAANASPYQVYSMATHRGSDEFMSLQQFEKFYWPGLKAMINTVAEAGKISFVLWEGIWDKRLQYLRELPKGKVVSWFDRTNLVKAKEVLGDTMCICGGMPLSLLTTGTAQQVRDHTKKVIETVGKDGGFIMASNTLLDTAQPSLVKVWVETTREFGNYG